MELVHQGWFHDPVPFLFNPKKINKTKKQTKILTMLKMCNWNLSSDQKRNLHIAYTEPPVLQWKNSFSKCDHGQNILLRLDKYI